MVTSISGSQYRLHNEAKCETMGTLWRILEVNNSAQRIFGEVTGFSLLLTILHSFQSGGDSYECPIEDRIKVFKYLMRVVTAGVCDNAVNRMKLHTVILSQTFNDLLSESGLICVEFERQVIQLLLELCLEMVLPPYMNLEDAQSSSSMESNSSSFHLITPSGSFHPNKERVYNAGAIRILIRLLLLFTPKVQLEVLDIIEKLARAGPFNQENLTSVGVH